MKEIKKSFKNIDEKVNPTIYQVRFENGTYIDFNDYPTLNELGEWLNTSSAIWSCHSDMTITAFDKKFLEITELDKNDVKIFDGGDGTNFSSPGWRQYYTKRE